MLASALTVSVHFSHFAGLMSSHPIGWCKKRNKSWLVRRISCKFLWQASYLFFAVEDPWVREYQWRFKPWILWRPHLGRRVKPQKARKCDDGSIAQVWEVLEAWLLLPLKDLDEFLISFQAYFSQIFLSDLPVLTPCSPLFRQIPLSSAQYRPSPSQHRSS